MVHVRTHAIILFFKGVSTRVFHVIIVRVQRITTILFGVKNSTISLSSMNRSDRYTLSHRCVANLFIVLVSPSSNAYTWEQSEKVESLQVHIQVVECIRTKYLRYVVTHYRATLKVVKVEGFHVAVRNVSNRSVFTSPHISVSVHTYRIGNVWDAFSQMVLNPRDIDVRYRFRKREFEFIIFEAAVSNAVSNACTGKNIVRHISDMRTA